MDGSSTAEPTGGRPRMAGRSKVMLAAPAAAGALTAGALDSQAASLAGHGSG